MQASALSRSSGKSAPQLALSATHLANIERPSEFNELLSEFLQRV